MLVSDKKPWPFVIYRYPTASMFSAHISVADAVSNTVRPGLVYETLFGTGLTLNFEEIVASPRITRIDPHRSSHMRAVAEPDCNTS